jgi:hypothetical protein
MRAVHAATGLCLLVGALGCPHAFGRGGTIDRAAHKDAEAMFDEEECPPKETLAEYCATDPDPKACYERCSEK